MNIENLTIRNRVFRATRDFFNARDFIEVETPIRIAAPAQETFIDAPRSGNAFLRPSPELHMKRLLVAGMPRIFQIGACFRSGECGRRHNPEFTMIEWYRAHADCMDILADTEALVLATLGPRIVYQNQPIDLTPPWPRLSVSEAFTRFAGWNPVTDWNQDRFDEDLVTRVEPFLPRDRPLVMTDYPAAAAALARLNPADPRVAERWEVYIGGLEIANAYTELCDPATQRARFADAAAERHALGKDDYPMDADFFAALDRGMPPSGGIALGMDRLVMLACDAPTLADARAFCESPGHLL